MAFRAKASNSNVDGAAASPTVGYPTLSANDVLLLSVVSDGIVTLTDPSGWTLLKSVQSTADNQTHNVWRKVATGSESGTLTIASSASLKAFDCLMGSWSGRDTTTPETFSTSTHNDSGNASPVTVSAVGGTAATGDDLVWFAELDQLTDTDTWAFAPPSGYVEQYDHANGSWISHSVATLDSASSGATGTVSGTATRATGTSGAGYTAILVALKAASGGGSPTPHLLACLGVG
jgi:hypothetical protein